MRRSTLPLMFEIRQRTFERKGCLPGLLASIVFLALLPDACLAAGKQLTGVYAPAATEPLAPAEAQKKFVVPEGFEVRLLAAEPDVVNPVAMTWDERGRLWVLELYEYPLGAPAGTKPRDRIKILEDTDNDGRADKITVFADGLNLATGLALGNGGVYVGQAPDLLFLQDTNHDDKADTRTVLLTGFGLDDRHELLNGFTWGPDGWLYMTHGVFTHSRVKIPEASAPGVEVTAAVARFDPRTKNFEVFADGTSNPWGVDFDRDGNAFVSACVLDHLFHMAPGGIYVRQGGLPANPHAYELLPSIVDHKHHMAAYCGICVYQGDQFPAEYQGHVFMGNIHQCAINQDRLTPNGSSFKATAEKDFLTTSDGWFRPVSEQVGPDGALWIADWYDKYPCYQNAQADPEGVDRTYGRIWRVIYTGNDKGKRIGSRPGQNMDLGKLANSDLVNLLEHPNVWQRRMAQKILCERSDKHSPMADERGPAIVRGVPDVRNKLEEMIEHGANTQARLTALLTAHSIAPVTPMVPGSNDLQLLPSLLQNIAVSSEPALRAWAIRFLGEQVGQVHRSIARDSTNAVPRAQDFCDENLARFERLARDPDPTIRLAVAIACREIVSTSLTVDTDVDATIPIGKVLCALTEASSDAKDPLLPFMIWMAGEPVFAVRPQRALSWLAANGPRNMPLAGILARKAMRRICDTADQAKIDLLVDFLEHIASQTNGVTTDALDGLIEGQRAKPMVPQTPTTALFETFRNNPVRQIRERAQELGTLWGNAASVQATLKSINDATLPFEDRSKAIAGAKTIKNDAARDALLTLIRQKNAEPLVIEAMQAVGALGGENVPGELLNRWNALSPREKAAASEVLVSRPRWAGQLLSAVESKAIAPSDLPITAIRSFADSKNEFIRHRAEQAIGRIRPVNEDKQKIIAEKKAMILQGGRPDLKAGHELAKKTCLVCHKLYGEGAEVGPDLTGVGRSSLDALLANVIDPNQVIGKGYENVIVQTKDDRTLNGRLVENTDTRIKLLSSGPKEDVIAKSDIVSMRVSDVSVMPEGLEQMPDQDFRNLILYVLNAGQEDK